LLHIGRLKSSQAIVIARPIPLLYIVSRRLVKSISSQRGFVNTTNLSGLMPSSRLPGLVIRMPLSTTINEPDFPISSFGYQTDSFRRVTCSRHWNARGVRDWAVGFADWKAIGTLHLANKKLTLRRETDKSDRSYGQERSSRLMGSESVCTKNKEYFAEVRQSGARPSRNTGHWESKCFWR